MRVEDRRDLTGDIRVLRPEHALGPRGKRAALRSGGSSQHFGKLFGADDGGDEFHVGVLEVESRGSRVESRERE